MACSSIMRLIFATGREETSTPSDPLKITYGEIIKAWDKIAPYREFGGQKVPKHDPYKKEDAQVLLKRQLEGYSNFENIGGNPETRVTEDGESFVEANWITSQLIATGYPTAGKMRGNYWEMIGTLQKTHAVFIVNLMSVEKVGLLGGWFFDCPEVEKKPFHIATLAYKDQPYYLYHYHGWKDFKRGEESIVKSFIEEIYERSSPLENVAIVVDCYAGLGSSGTFANLLHFYREIREAKELRKEDFSIDVIMKNIERFRTQRGDIQFLQTLDQFMMLCKMIEFFFNEEVDKRASKE